MSDLTEKTAMAIYRAGYNPDYASAWDMLNEITRRKYRCMATAALLIINEHYSNAELVPQPEKTKPL